MKKLICIALVLIMLLGFSSPMYAAKISPEGRTILGWNNWDVISGTAVTTRVDPDTAGHGRDEMVKIDGGEAITSFDKAYDGVLRITIDVFGETVLSLCDDDDTRIATITLSNGLINETACSYDANAWQKVVVYVLPAISSYDVYLYDSEKHTKVLRGTMTVAPITGLSVSATQTAYVDNIKIEELEQLEKLSDEDLISEFSTSSASDFSKVKSSGGSYSTTTDYKYGNKEFDGETVFYAEDCRNEEGTSTRTGRYAYKRLDNAITGTAVYSFDIYSAPTHVPTGATGAVDNDARLVFCATGVTSGQLLYLQQTKLTADTDHSIRYPEGKWFNLRVEIVKETGHINYYVSYLDGNGEMTVNSVQRKSSVDTKALSIGLNNRQDRNGIFYLKNISVSRFNDEEAILNSFSVTSEWEEPILRGSVDDLEVNFVNFLNEDSSKEYALPQENGSVKSVEFSDYTGDSDGKRLIVAVYDDGALSGIDIIDADGAGEYPLERNLKTQEDSIVKVFCWDKKTLSPYLKPLEINKDRHVLDGKKIIVIGNSYTYYGKTVIDQAQYVGSKIKTARFNDKGYLHQICKQNGATVEVTNWTWGAHSVEDLFGGSCDADRGHNGYDHLADLMANTDMDYDYVVIQPGSGGTVATLEAGIEKIQNVFKKENPRVKLLLSVHTSYYRNKTESNAEIIASLDSIAEKYGVIIVNWAELVTDILSGDAIVENATQEYTANSFFVSKSKSDGYHPNMLVGYITTQMIYSAITGEKAFGEKYAFCTKKSINSNFNVSTFLKKYYTYDNITGNKTLTGDALTNFPEIFASPDDMAGIQKLIDDYLGIDDGI